MSRIAAALAAVRYSVRYRLLAIALLPMLVILPLLLAVSIYRWNARFDTILSSKVDSDLTVAHRYLLRILENTEQQLTSFAESARFQDLVTNQSTGSDLDMLLRREAEGLKLDFLYIVDGEGHIVASEQPIASARWDWPIIRSALSGRPETGIDVFESMDLVALSPELAQRARLRLVPAVGAVETGRSEEKRGLVIHSASPLTLSNGRRAALVGGILLNQNLGFIDTINDLVYHDASLPEGSRGTATLFLDDVRISTNVRLFEGHRALGTRVSAAVRAAVLGLGRTWLESAFVVDDWFVSAYEPIVDTYGRRVGMLYVGFLEKPFIEAKRETVVGIAIAFLVSAAVTVPIFLMWASRIFRPIERMASTIARVEDGDLAARTGSVKGKGEIREVALHLDDLLDRVQERDAQLHQWNDDLNRRVEERTLKLQQANQQLETTTKQLIMSEKLAAIGEITAGIAHEINNPIAVMQGNLEVIRELMGSNAASAKTEFRLIEDQMNRMSELVAKLLQFAKPQEYSGDQEQQSVSETISDCLPLVEHLLKKTTISVERTDNATRPVRMNRIELQQVLVNLMVNATHAMPNGGRLVLRTFDLDMDGRAGVMIEVADTGVGMKPEVMQRVFDPFFTTKRREGTGLGLSISQMLVTRQGGKITVKSEPDAGTVFSVWLPEAA